MTMESHAPPRYRRPWKNLAISVARALLQKGGGLHDVRYWNRDGFRILMYHDFPAPTSERPDFLAKQCAHIARHYQVLSLTEIAQALHSGKRLPQNAVVVTVDDGNRDFFVNGYPVFRAYRIPVTAFLVSGFLDRKLWLWWDKIEYLVTESQKSSFQFALSTHLPPAEFTLETNEQRRHAISTIVFALKTHAMDEREAALQQLSRLLAVEIPSQAPPQWAPLDWSEVRHMADNEMEFGGHTVTHPLLSRITDVQELLREIGDCKRRIEEELNRPALHFCYPYGCWDDFNDHTLKVVKECQYRTAVTAEHGLNYRGAHPFTLRRISVEPTTSEVYFQELLAGLHLKSHEEEPTPFA